MVYNGKQLYSEKASDSEKYRRIYASSVGSYISKAEKKAAQARQRYISAEKIASEAERERYRRDFYKMLGSPLTEYAAGLELPAAKKEFIAEDDMGKIYRVLMDSDGGFTFYGVLFLPSGFDESDENKKYPYIISQHGGGGTPELCSDFYFETNYTNMTRRVLERGAVVFAPQLLLWDQSNFGAPYDRMRADNSLRQLGSSITALEVYFIMRSTDYFAAQRYIDKDRIGMIGLSYGGLYTMMAAAADTRIKSAYSSCFFNDRQKYNNSDWAWKDAANAFLDAETAALIAPRRLYIEAGKDDTLFGAESAYSEYLRLLPYYEAAGAADRLRFNIFEGGHMLDASRAGVDFLFEGLAD